MIDLIKTQLPKIIYILTTTNKTLLTYEIFIFLHLFVYFLRDQKNNNPFPGEDYFSNTDLEVPLILKTLQRSM